jgi:hypothetical protein
VRLDNAPEGKTISALLEAGEVDGFIAPRPPTLVEKGHPHVGWLFDDPTAVAKDYYKRTAFFPIMHAVGIRRALADRHPWLPGAVLKGFEQAKAAGLAKLSDTSAARFWTISSPSTTPRGFRGGGSRSMSCFIRRLTRRSSFRCGSQRGQHRGARVLSNIRQVPRLWTRQAAPANCYQCGNCRSGCA